MTAMRIAFGTDDATELTDHLRRHLRDAGHTVVDGGDGDPWPDVGRRVGELVAAGAADVGIVCCWTGTGVSIAANKVPGVRAALCGDAATADGARRWNDANVLALSLRTASTAVAEEIVAAFLAGTVDPGEDELIARVEPGAHPPRR